MNKPDSLLVEIERSIFPMALVISLILHALLLGLTSFSLFRDWGRYGVKSPSAINALKAAENKAAEERKRTEAQNQKADAASAKAQEAAAKAAPAKGDAPKAASGKGEAAKSGAAPAAGAATDAKKTPPEVEPMAPAKGIDDAGVFESF